MYGTTGLYTTIRFVFCLKSCRIKRKTKLSLSYDGSENDSIQSVAELPIGEEIEGSFVWIDRSLRFELGEVVLCLFGDPKCVLFWHYTVQ